VLFLAIMAKSLIISLCLVVIGLTAANGDNKTAVLESHGLSVVCTNEYMEAKLDISKHPGVSPDRANLYDSKCRITKAVGSFLFFRTKLDGCGTKHNTTDKDIIYYNSIFAESQAGSNNAKISRSMQAEFPFKCTYPRSAILSVVSFTPRRKVLYTRASDFGNFTFMMDLFQTDKFENMFEEYPIKIDLNEWLNVQTSVKSNDSKLALFNGKCWATPTSDRDDSNNFVFLDKGCKKEKDEAMTYDFKTNEPVQQFRIRAFRFVTGATSEVFLHCRVEVCREGDKDSNCAKGCAGGGRRRRSLASDSASEVLTVGAIKVVKGANAQSATGNASSFTTISAIAGVLAVLVIALVAVLVVVYKRRQAVPSNVVFKKVSDNEQLMA